LTSTLGQLEPVLRQLQPKGAIFGVLSQSRQSAAFLRLFVKEAKQISVAPSCRPTFVGMEYLASQAFKRVKVGQSAEPWRPAHKVHLLSTTWATWRSQPRAVGAFVGMAITS
jgi:hypothetical protein